MKHFNRFLALIIAFCMIFPLSACLGEVAEVTTEPPAASAEETTSEEMLPPEDETTSLYDKLAAMEPLALLRLATKNTRNYRSYIKYTEITLNYPEIGEIRREIVYVKNNDDFSQLTSIDGNRDSYLMYSDGELVILDSYMGEMGYAVKIENESQYTKVMGNGPIVKNPTLFDFSGNDNFAGGIVSAGEEGFIVNVDLSAQGRGALINAIAGEPNTDYSVSRASVTAWIDHLGEIISVSFDADLTLKRLGKEAAMSFSTYSSLERTNEDISIAPPDDMKLYRFDNFDTFYNFYGCLIQNYVKVFNYEQNFAYKNTVYIDKIANNRSTLLYQSETRGRVNYTDGINFTHKVTTGPEKVDLAFYYYVDRQKTYLIENAGEIVERNDVSPQELYEKSLLGFFENFVGNYDPAGGCQIHQNYSEYSYTLTIESETAMELVHKYLELVGYDPQKCQINITGAYNSCSSAKKDQPINLFRIRIFADIECDGETFELVINDLTEQFTGTIYFDKMFE